MKTTLNPAEGTKANWRSFFHLIKETKPSKWKVGIALFLSVATTLVSLVIPLFTKDLVDSFTLSSISPGQIVILAIAFVAQAIAGGVSIYFAQSCRPKHRGIPA